MKDGEIVQQGSYAELLADATGYLAEMVREYGSHEHKDDKASIDGSDAVDEKKEKKTQYGTKSRAKAGDQKRQLMTTEERDVGAVKFAVYKDYFKAAGGLWTMFLLVALLAATQVARIGNDTWLGYWSSGTYGFTQSIYIGVYIVWGAGQGILVLLTGFCE